MRRPLGRHYIELTRAELPPAAPVGHRSARSRASCAWRWCRRTSRHEPSRRPSRSSRWSTRRAAQIRACYERRLKRDPSLAGTVSLRLKVGDAGQVSRVSVEESTLPIRSSASACASEADGWSFTVGRNATVVYPFVFRTQ